jgi:uncharacterized protein
MRLSLPLLANLGVEPAVPRKNSPSSPRNPHVHLFDAQGVPHLFVVNGSRIYGVGQTEVLALQEALDARDPDAVSALLATLALDLPLLINDEPPPRPPVRALSLAVAQKCNLGCSYCYAQEGAFGGETSVMPLEVALASVDLLFRDRQDGEHVHLTFLGGEPLLARSVLGAATEHAQALGCRHGVSVGFAITTNGTLLTPEDGAFFEEHGFAVTVSIDGLGEAHDRQRPFKGGRGSFEQVIDRVKTLLAMQRRMQVSARVTVTPANLDLPATLAGLIELGFHSVGFSPMLASPTRRGQMGHEDLDVMLEQMTACGREFERRVSFGDRYPFANMVNAMREIHRGTHRPYPCGAGAGYFGVSADGELSACHRFVNDATGTMGSVVGGVDVDRQARWLTDRHVHRQEPCRSCWARYLCGGGCHHEVIHAGRPACDYIRGWLHYCLGAYVRLLAVRPDFFGKHADAIPTLGG